MKTLLEFLNEVKSNKNQSDKISWLSWPSSHTEIKLLKHKKSADVVAEERKPTPDSIIHSHEDVAPQEVTTDHKKAFKLYGYDPTAGHYIAQKSEHRTSSNINGYLRNKAGDKNETSFEDYGDENMNSAVNALSSAFQSINNTNRIPMTVYSGIPPRIGRKLMKDGKGSHHLLAGFTSTSTNLDIASVFAGECGRRAEDGRQEFHTLHITLQPHAGISIRPYTGKSHEHEVLVNHGSKLVYDRSDVKNTSWSVSYTHHVTVYPQHLALDQYPEGYEHKERGLYRFW